jgi:hypothetical protein
MSIPFVIDNQQHRMVDALNEPLAPKTQPYQDLIDRILYRMAGLTDAEAQGLEKRLEGML